jgi:hypothetical protein
MREDGTDWDGVISVTLKTYRGIEVCKALSRRGKSILDDDNAL